MCFLSFTQASGRHIKVSSLLPPDRFFQATFFFFALKRMSASRDNYVSKLALLRNLLSVWRNLCGGEDKQQQQPQAQSDQHQTQETEMKANVPRRVTDKCRHRRNAACSLVHYFPFQHLLSVVLLQNATLHLASWERGSFHDINFLSRSYKFSSPSSFCKTDSLQIGRSHIRGIKGKAIG